MLLPYLKTISSNKIGLDLGGWSGEKIFSLYNTWLLLGSQFRTNGYAEWLAHPLCLGSHGPCTIVSPSFLILHFAAVSRNNVLVQYGFGPMGNFYSRCRLYTRVSDYNLDSLRHNTDALLLRHCERQWRNSYNKKLIFCIIIFCHSIFY